MKRSTADGTSKDEPLTGGDLLRLLGFPLLLGAFLMLISTPQLVFQSLNRDGYSRTEAEVLTGPGRSRSIRIRIASTGEEITVRRTMFDGIGENRREPIWYNPSARLVLGVTVFDERALSTGRHQELPDLSQAFFASLLTVALGAAGAYLLFRTPKSARRRRPASSRRRSVRT